MARSFIIEQDGQSRSFTVSNWSGTGRGRRGPPGADGQPGSDADVTNANVNAAIAEDPAATRDALDLSGSNRYGEFISLLTESGLYDDLLDGVILQSPYTSSSGGEVETIMGNTATIVGGGEVTAEGLSFDGSSQRMSFPIADSTSGTVVAEMHYPWQFASQYAVPFSISAGTSYTNGALMQLRVASGSPTGAAPMNLSTHSGAGYTYTTFY